MKKRTYKISKITKIVDGDTIDAIIDLGFNIGVKKRIRFYGVDTWESRTRDKAEKAKGLKAKEFTENRLLGADEIILDSYGVGKYGRVLGELFVDGVLLNKELIDNGHAYIYHGGKKKEFKAK